MRSAGYVPCATIAGRLGLQPGWILLLASDVTRLAYTAQMNEDVFQADAWLRSFTDALGPDGTLAVPTFNWNFRKGEPYDIRRSPATTGALARRALRLAGFRRTRHPLHSFAVAGKHQDAICALENVDSFGPDSPFAYFHQHRARMLLVDLDYQRSFTFVHYVEAGERVWYRYPQVHTADYIDADGRVERKSYSYYKRRFGVFNRVNPIGEVLEQKGIALSARFNDIPFVLIDLAAAFEEIRRDIRHNGARRLRCLLPAFAFARLKQQIARRPAAPAGA